MGYWQHWNLHLRMIFFIINDVFRFFKKKIYKVLLMVSCWIPININFFLFVSFPPFPLPRKPLLKRTGISQPIYTTSALDNHTVLTNYTTEDTGSSSDSASSIVMMAEEPPARPATTPVARSNNPSDKPSQIWSPTGQFFARAFRSDILRRYFTFFGLAVLRLKISFTIVFFPDFEFVSVTLC